MESLHDELIMDILSRVPTLNLPKLRYVCKRWNNILNDPLFPRLHHPHSMSNPNENQVLVLKQSSGLYWVDFTDKTSPSPRKVAIDLPSVPDLCCFHCVGSCNGLLCLGNVTSSLFIIINPITHQCMLFSMHLNISYYVYSWGFGFNEINKLFKVVMVVKDRKNPGHLEVRICDLGSGGSADWRNLGVTTFHMLGKAACFLSGRLHWLPYRLNDSRGIISFDLANEEFTRVLTPGYDCPFHSPFCLNLNVLEGCLCIIQSQFLGRQKLHIWIMKEYGIKASWVKKFVAQPPLHRIASKVLGSVKDGGLVVSAVNLASPFSSSEEVFLISSDSTWDEIKHLQLGRPPSLGGLIIHVASLEWI